LRHRAEVGDVEADEFGAQTAFAQGGSGSLALFLVDIAGGVDVPSVYVFRGIVREQDPQFTMQPWGELGFALRSGGNGAMRDVKVSVGVWNSLQTGSSGSNGFSQRLHYEEDFYSVLSLGLAGRFTLAAAFTAYTSPNVMFDTVKEASVRLSHESWLRPYGLAAFDIGKDGFDLGRRKGTYVEVGVAPSHALGRLTLAVPARLGVSGKDYYEHPITGVDHRFGFAEVGGIATWPLNAAGGRFGSWDLHGGARVLALGDTTKFLNDGKGTKVVMTAGLGVRY